MDFKQCILLGLPGVGVKDQAIALAERWTVPYVSAGALLRDAIATQSAIGQEAQSYVEAGELVPDQLVIKLIRKRLQQPDVMLHGWVLEGFPRTIRQAEALDAMLANFGLPVAKVVYLKAMMGLLVNKLWTKNNQREPSNVIRQRLREQQEALEPLVGYYEGRSQFTTINGSLSFAEVSGKLFLMGYEDTEAVGMIKDEAELNSLIRAESLLVVDGLASWCGSCKLVTPMIDQLADTYGDRAKVMKMDFDANKQIPKRFGLKGMPAVMFFKNGELQETLTGVKPYQIYSATVTRFL
ncbi:MAG: nucleoside monophosphate kinase [Cyanobacteria bacterium P01_F01_bin.150]